MATNIPDDILILIFLFCVQLDPIRNTRTPTLLSHICTAWRAVALNTAQLWTTIDFGRIYKTDIHPESCIHFARQAEWIRRSKGALLDITVSDLSTADDDRIDETKAIVERIHDLLTPHADRWRTLNLESSPSLQMASFLETLRPLNFPSLKALIIAHAWGDKRYTIHAFRPGSTPRLERLAAPASMNFSRPFIKSLTGLRVIDISASNFSPDVVDGAGEIVALIRRSPGLRRLLIAGPVGRQPSQRDRPTVSGGEIIVAPQLEDLVIQTANLQAAVLRLIQAPASSGYNWTTTPEFLPILHLYNPFPNLRYIFISDSGDPCPYPLSELPDMLAHLNVLEHMTIFRFFVEESNSDKEWVRGFSRICPKLKSMHLGWGLGISEDAIRALVENRKAWGEPITRLALEVIDTSDISSELVSWLEGNVAEVNIAEEEDEGYPGFGLFD